MKLGFLILIIGLPIAEIATLIEVGGYFGLWQTIGIIIFTAFLGTSFLRYQGLAALYRARESLLQNTLPLGEVFNGVCIIIAGIFLLIPGFITDVVGFLLFVPLIRNILRFYLTGHVSKTSSFYSNIDGQGSGSSLSGADIIDGEYDDVTLPTDEDNHPKKIK